MIKAFFFDLDGTIWDSQSVIIDTLQSTILKERGRSISKETLLKDLKAYQSPLKVLAIYGVYSPTSYWKRYLRNSEDIVLFYTNTHEVFDELLKYKKFIGYITSLKKEFTIKLLNKFDLYEYASILITPSECRTPKPSPRPILVALEKKSLNGNETIYIGDQAIDVIAAKKSGCKAGLATWGANERTSEKPDYVFHALEDVLSLV